MGAKSEERQQVRLVVADTGPVLHLTEANALDLLRFTGEVHIPERVEAELSTLDPAWQKPAWLLVSTLLEPHASEAKAWHQAGLLDAGEAQAIALARQLQSVWFLTDDAAARLVAQSLGLEVHGSLGIVLWAAATGHLNRKEAQATLKRLEQSSLWISATVLTQAKSALDQLFQQK